jgi:hypothetical protein
VVGSRTEHDSFGQLPSGLRGAGVAVPAPPLGPEAGLLPAPANNFSMSFFFFSIAASWVCWVRTSVSMAVSCSA